MAPTGGPSTHTVNTPNSRSIKIYDILTLVSEPSPSQDEPLFHTEQKGSIEMLRASHENVPGQGWPTLSLRLKSL